MKRLVCACLFLLLPTFGFASKLADCDALPYEVIVKNGGQERRVTLTPFNGTIEEYGPRVSYQLAGQPSVIADLPDTEYCIWSGRIKLQRLHTVNDSGPGGGGWR
jgi:hypothetical protein